MVVNYAREFALNHSVWSAVVVGLNYLVPAVLAVIIISWVVIHARAARIQSAASRVYNSVLKILLSAALAYILSRLIGFIYFRPRPFVTLDFVPLISESPLLKSFPSSHAIVAFALATALYRFDKKFGLAAFGCAVIIALTRVAVGVHYPTDILAGAALGVIVSWLTPKLWPTK